MYTKNGEEEDSVTTLGGNDSNALICSDESSHASSAQLLGLTPLKDCMSPESFISPATHTLNILSQQDTNNLRYDFSQMENDAATLYSQRSPNSPDDVSKSRTASINNKYQSPVEVGNGTPNKEGSRRCGSIQNVTISPKPSVLANDLAEFEKKAALSMLYTHRNSGGRRAAVVVQAKNVFLLDAATPVSAVVSGLPIKSNTTEKVSRNTEKSTTMVNDMHSYALKLLDKLHVHTIVFPETGTLGMSIQRWDYGGLELCKVTNVHKGTQAHGKVEEGDLICNAFSWDSNKNWLSFLQTLELIRARKRPLFLCVARRQDETTNSTAASCSPETSLKDNSRLDALTQAAAEAYSSSKFHTSSTMTDESYADEGVTSSDINVPDMKAAAKCSLKMIDNDVAVSTDSALKVVVGLTPLNSLSETAFSCSDCKSNGHSLHECPNSRWQESLFCQACNDGTVDHQNLCQNHAQYDSDICKSQWQKINDGVRLDCKVCKFELKHGWRSSSGRYKHKCHRAKGADKKSPTEKKATCSSRPTMSTIPMREKGEAKTTMSSEPTKAGKNRNENNISIIQTRAIREAKSDVESQPKEKETRKGTIISSLAQERATKEAKEAMKCKPTEKKETWKGEKLSIVQETLISEAQASITRRLPRGKTSRKRTKFTQIQTRAIGSTMSCKPMKTRNETMSIIQTRPIEGPNTAVIPCDSIETKNINTRGMSILQTQAIGDANATMKGERTRKSIVADPGKTTTGNDNSIKTRTTILQLESPVELEEPNIGAVVDRSMSQTASIVKATRESTRKSATQDVAGQILRVDESINIKDIEVQFCFACKKKSKYHNALCPQHPHFETSGAAEKLELVRRGVNLACQACVFHFNNGYPDKSREHSTCCDCNLGKTIDNSKDSTLTVKETKTCSKAANDSQVTNKGKKRPLTASERFGDIEKLPDGSFLSSRGRKVTMSQKGKAVNFEFHDHCSQDSESSAYKPGKEDSQRISRNKIPTDNDEVAIPAFPASSIIIKPRWKKSTNPWGMSEHREGDVVLALPIDGFTSHEVAFSGKRFVEKPFTPDSPYKDTHVSPEQGVQLLQLTRDPLGLTPWGFTFASHVFGGACLVTSVDSLSPASTAIIHGSTTNSALHVHDMVLSVNGRNIGGMTELGLEVELEISGPIVQVAVSRYRFDTSYRQDAEEKEEAELQVLEEMLGDKTELGWHEVALTDFPQDDCVPRLLLSPKKMIETQACASLETRTEHIVPKGDCNTDTDRSTSFMIGADNIPNKQPGWIERDSKYRCAKHPSPHKDRLTTRVATMTCVRGTVVPGENGIIYSLYGAPHNDHGSETDCSETLVRNEEHREAIIDVECESVNEYDDDDNPWSGCVCGEIHEPPIPVFWIQCDQCDAWFNVWERCTGLSEENASLLSEFKCWSCHPPDMQSVDEGSGYSLADIKNRVTEEGDIENGSEMKTGDSRVVQGTPHDDKHSHCPSRGSSRNGFQGVCIDDPKCDPPTLLSSSEQPKRKRNTRIEVGTLVQVTERRSPGINELGGVGRITDSHVEGGHTLYDIKYMIGNHREYGIDSEWVKLHVGFEKSRRSLTQTSH